MRYRKGFIKIEHIILAFALAICVLCPLSGCGKDDSVDEETTQAVINGEVKSSEDFAQIGVYINVGVDDVGVTDVKYKISGDIAIVSFRYNGVRVEFRGSYKYSQYELAGVEDSSNGNLITTDIDGCSASLYTLDPGRIVFWSEGHINYSLYVYVTATDDVVRDILTHISFESRYDQRADVKGQIEADSRQFAEKIIKVFSDKDLETLVDMIDYPQELGNGNSVANRNELLNIDKDKMFTDILLKALNEENALDEMREIDGEFIIGTNYKNVHFKLMDDGQFLITKINN